MWKTRDLLLAAVISAVLAVVTTVFLERKLAALVESKLSARYMDQQLHGSAASVFPSTNAASHMMSALGKTRVDIPPRTYTGEESSTGTAVSEHVAPSGSGTRWTPL
jgi:hypothetical protein